MRSAGQGLITTRSFKQNSHEALKPLQSPFLLKVGRGRLAGWPAGMAGWFFALVGRLVGKVYKKAHRGDDGTCPQVASYVYLVLLRLLLQRDCQGVVAFFLTLREIVLAFIRLLVNPASALHEKRPPLMDTCLVTFVSRFLDLCQGVPG